MEFDDSDDEHLLQVLESSLSLITNSDKVVCYLVIDTDMGMRAKLTCASIAVLLCLRK